MVTRNHELGMADNFKTARMLAPGSLRGAVALGVAAGAMSILGLIGWYPLVFAASATICVGVAFLVEGGTIAAWISKFAGRRESEAIGGGMALESLTGVAGVALGVLALLGIWPLPLLCVAAIVYGCGVLLETGAIARLNALIPSGSHLAEKGWYRAHEAVSAKAGIDTMCGFTGMVLGILGLIGFAPLTLVLVALLSFGCVMMLSGTSLTTKMPSVLSR